MDSVSSPEFARIFDRVRAVVDLQGAMTALEIENRMKIAIYLARRRRAESPKMVEKLRKQLRRELGRRASKLERQAMALKLTINRALRDQRMYIAEQLNKLIEHDFAGRAIWEANRHPRGIVAQTLVYGSEMADYRFLTAQARSQARFRGTSPEARAKRRGLIRRVTG